MAKELMTVKEVAHIFKVSRGTVTMWARAGKLKGIKIGRAWKFSQEEIVRVSKEGL